MSCCTTVDGRCRNAQGTDCGVAPAQRLELPTLLTSRAKAPRLQGRNEPKIPVAINAFSDSIMSDSKPYLDNDSPVTLQRTEELEFRPRHRIPSTAGLGMAGVPKAQDLNGGTGNLANMGCPLVLFSEGLTCTSPEVPLTEGIDSAERSGNSKCFQEDTRLRRMPPQQGSTRHVDFSSLPVDIGMGDVASEANAGMGLGHLDGRWTHRFNNDPNLIEVISKGMLFWFDGSRSKIQAQGIGEISVKLRGTTFRAHLSGGCLHWDDGDVWVPASLAEEQEEEAKASRLRAAWNSTDDHLSPGEEAAVNGSLFSGSLDVDLLSESSVSDDGDLQALVGRRMEAILEHSFSDDGDLHGLLSRQSL